MKNDLRPSHDLTLIVDTSLWGLAVGLVASSQKAKRIFEDVGASDTSLEKLIDEVCVEMGVSLTDVKRILVSLGPGSFTGIRSGLAWSYGMMRGAPGRLIAGRSSLEAAVLALAEREGCKALQILLPMSRLEGILGTWNVEKGWSAKIVPFTSPECRGEDVWRVDPFLSYGAPQITGSKFIARRELLSLSLLGLEKSLHQIPDDEWGREPLPSDRLLYLKKSSAEERKTANS